MTEEEYITTREAARRLEVTPQQVRAMIHAGRLPAQKVGRDWLIRPDDADLVKDREPEPPKQEQPTAEPYAAQEEVVECPACAGEGQIFPGVEADLWDGRLRWPDALQAETCDLCEGTGEVDPETAAEWEEGDREVTD